MLVKFIISSILLISTGIVGYLTSQRYNLRVREISYLQIAMNNLEAEILYYSNSLPIAMRRVGTRIHKNIGHFFVDAYEMLDSKKGYKVDEAWEKSVLKNINNTCLNKADKEILVGFGKELGMGDKETQRKHFEFTKILLEEQRNIALKEKEVNGKLFNRLGILLGLGLVIILI